MNSPDERGAPHLWGHIQEGVLAEVAVRLGRDDWLAIASRSAELVFASAVRSGFDLVRVQPYDVASAVYTLSRLAADHRRPRLRQPGDPLARLVRRAEPRRPAGLRPPRGTRGRRRRPPVRQHALREPRPTSSAPRPSSMTRLRWPAGSRTRKAYLRASRRQATRESQAAERKMPALVPGKPASPHFEKSGSSRDRVG